jgi:hypothetical protein
MRTIASIHPALPDASVIVDSCMQLSCRNMIEGCQISWPTLPSERVPTLPRHLVMYTPFLTAIKLATWA